MGLAVHCLQRLHRCQFRKRYNSLSPPPTGERNTAQWPHNEEAVITKSDINPGPHRRGAGDWLSRLECIVLEPRTGAGVRPEPPVRIFVGTETAQFRPERVFIWSIEQVRDPSRRYEIYLMRSVPGFHAGAWTTGFTNYRFAIPSFCNYQGRAIYNDVDQIYLVDPARLFDMDMAQFGFRAISPRESSVMVMDCARMEECWNLDTAQRVRKRPLLKRAEPLYGELDPQWNARDNEYFFGLTKVLHFTTLHTQPWRPLPDRFVYQPHTFAATWFALERSADRAGFMLFTRQQPSRRYQLIDSSGPVGTKALSYDLKEQVPAIRELASRTESNSVLTVGAGIAKGLAALSAAGFDITESVAGRNPFPALPQRRFDGVVCSGVLEALPDSDIPWILDELFAAAERFLYVTIDVSQNSAGVYWWCEQLKAANRRRPGTYWRLAIVGQRKGFGTPSRWYAGGQYSYNKFPSVWVLTDGNEHDTAQSLTLADALGWPYEVKKVSYSVWAGLHNRLLGASLLGLTPQARAGLQAPWPDLLIAAGRRSAPVARWLREQSCGHIRLVQIGRDGADDARLFDVAITPRYARLFPHPNRVEIPVPLRLLESSVVEPGDKPDDSVAVLIGGGSEQFQFNESIARKLAHDIAAWSRRLGSSVGVVLSPRISAAQSQHLSEGLEGIQPMVLDGTGETRAKYQETLAKAAAIMVTGDDEFMLAEACSAGKPVLIYELPERASFRWSSALRDMVSGRAEARPANDRGTVRPQLGLERWCARLIETGWIRPTLDMRRCHKGLIDRGAARMFSVGLGKVPVQPLRAQVDLPCSAIQSLFIERPVTELADADAQIKNVQNA